MKIRLLWGLLELSSGVKSLPLISIALYPCYHDSLSLCARDLLAWRALVGNWARRLSLCELKVTFSQLLDE